MSKKAVFSIVATAGYLLLSFLASSCDPSKSGEPIFDRKAMLQNYADNFIKPAYIQLQNQTNVLHSAVLVFNTNPTAQTLADLQSIWASAYADWQYANAYNFGPAGESGLRKGLVEEVGTFPASKIKIETSIALAQWNVEDFNRDARGFLAIEYLIFGQGQSADDVLALFDAYPNRRNYLAAIAEHLRNRTSEVLTFWNGTYRSEFVENDGTDVGSSTSQLYNEFVRSYESIKNFKLGLPLGKRPGQTQSEPQLVEAFYSGQSLAMLKNHVAAIENIWHGRSRSGQDGIGFREYLESVEGGDALIASTEAQLAALKTALAAVPESPSLSEQIAGDNSKVEALYVEFSKMTRFFKSDMSSLLGIAITFSSGDGD
ncbi:MAG: imelysin family protein [Saprospiraceae bacterium]